MEPLTATINGFTVPATPNSPTQTTTPTTPPATIQPKPENTIPLTTVSTEKVTIPEAPVSTTTPTFTNEADRILEESQVEDTEAQQLGNKLSESIFSSLQNLTGEKQALGEAQVASGVGQFKKQLQDINSQILKKQAELQQDDVRLIQSVQNLEQQKIPMEFITGQQQSVQRDAQIARALKASEIGILNASALATQGNIALAMETAQQAVDLKYAPYKEEIALYKSQLEALAPILSRDEKKQAREQELKANLALKDLDKRQANDKALQDILINASSQNAPVDLLNRAKNAKTPSEAAMILGQYAGDFYKTELLKQQISTEKAQRAKIYADMSASEIAAQTPEIDAWVANISSGKAKLSDVPAKLKNGVSIGLSKTTSLAPEVKAKIEAAQSTYDLAQELKTLQGKGGAVGFGWKKSVFSKVPGIDEEPIAGTDRANYESKFRQLKDTLAASNLDKIKGAMSDKDIEFLRNIGTALNLDMGEKAFDIELEKVANTMSKVPGVTPKRVSNPFTQALGQNNSTIPGASIVNKVTDDGSVIFTIPK